MGDQLDSGISQMSEKEMFHVIQLAGVKVWLSLELKGEPENVPISLPTKKELKAGISTTSQF